MRARIAAFAWIVGWPARTLLIAGIRIYRITLSGLLGPACRFHPTCSAYAEAAIRNVGAARGVALAVWRILRCSPLTPGGVDYPPGPRARGRGQGRQRARQYVRVIQMGRSTIPRKVGA